MAAESSQRVVVIQDATRELSTSALRWALQGLCLKPGDQLILLGVLHQFNNPMGYRIKVDSSSMFGTNKKIIAEEIERKEEQYRNNAEIAEISRLCQAEQVEFIIKVRAGSPSKMVAQRAARKIEATWIVLERHWKNDKRYFMENLSCGISLMNKGNVAEQLRGPKVGDDKQKLTPERISNVSYDEMIPESTDVTIYSNKSSPAQDKRKSMALRINSRLGSMEASSPEFLKEEEYTATTELEIGGEKSPISTTTSEDWIGGNDEETDFKNSVCSICKNRRPKVRWKRDFTFAELHAATEGFSPKNFLSEGGFGSVYRGEIDGIKIAVKQHKNASFQGEREFKAEVQVLKKARHENLVVLLGSCSEGKHRLLVYEYVCNGSLDQHISKHTRRPLSWEKRMKIALGAATGLQYLHENNIIHRDMRPNNILVTHDFEAMLGDFGLARTQLDSDYSFETGVVGTLGYLAPEYAEMGRVSTKTDVYAFGVVLLQLITGKKTSDKTLAGKSLVGWARPLLKERNYHDLIDQRIRDSHDVHQLFWMVRITEKCLSRDPYKRLPAVKIVYALNYLLDPSTVCIIRDFSPAQSDSGSQDSSESPREDYESSIFTVEETASESSGSRVSSKLPLSPSILHSRKSSFSTTYGESSSSSEIHPEY